jgi:hypothetical protein
MAAELKTVPGTKELLNQIDDYDFKPALTTLAELKRKWIESNG